MASFVPDRFIPLTQITTWRDQPTRLVYVNLDRVRRIYRDDTDQHTIVEEDPGGGEAMTVIETLDQIIAIATAPQPLLRQGEGK